MVAYIKPPPQDRKRQRITVLRRSHSRNPLGSGHLLGRAALLAKGVPKDTTNENCQNVRSGTYLRLPHQ